MNFERPRRFISVRDAAAYLSMNYHNLYEMIAKEKVPAIRVGRSIRVDLKALEADFSRQLEAYQKNKDRQRSGVTGAPRHSPCRSFHTRGRGDAEKT